MRPRGGVRPRGRRRRGEPRLHPHVARAARSLVVGGRADAAARSRSCSRRGRRSRSTRSAAGRARRSSRCPSSPRCARRAPVGFGIEELRHRRRTGARAPDDLWGRRLRRPRPAGARLRPAPARLRCGGAALRVAERWIVERQERDGSWGGIQPPWVWSIVALHALGYELDHPVVARALAGLDSFTIDDEQGRRIEACQSPVWDTALAVIALLDAGLEPDDPAIVARRRLARRAGDRHARATGRCGVPALAPGGFPFEFANDNYPDVDDTAEVVLALRRAGIGTGPAQPIAASPGCSGCRAAPAAGAPSTSTTRAASAASSPSATSARSPTRRAPTSPPTCSRRSRYEGRAGEPAGPARSRLAAAPAGGATAPGSAAGARTTSTGPARRPPGARGLRPGRPSERRDRRQAGSRACRTQAAAAARTSAPTATARWRGRGVSTASQTAWALLGLHAAGAGHGPAAERRRALPGRDASGRDGGWDEPLLHRHRVPGRLLPQLPPLPGRLPGDGARPRPRRARGERAARARPAADRAARARQAARLRACCAPAWGPTARASPPRGHSRDGGSGARRRRPLRRGRAASCARARSSAPPSSLLEDGERSPCREAPCSPPPSSAAACASRSARSSPATRILGPAERRLPRRRARRRHGVGLACRRRSRAAVRRRACRRRRRRAAPRPTRAWRSPACRRCGAFAASAERSRSGPPRSARSRSMSRPPTAGSLRSRMPTELASR